MQRSVPAKLLIPGCFFCLAVASLVAGCGSRRTSQQLDLNFAGAQVGLPRIDGDCQQTDLTLGDIDYSGRITGSVTGDGQLVLLAQQERGPCTTGNVSGAWLISRSDGATLSGTLHGVFSVGSGSSPEWSSPNISLSIQDATGGYSGGAGRDLARRKARWLWTIPPRGASRPPAG